MRISDWSSVVCSSDLLMRKAPAWSILLMGYYIESFIDEAKQSLAHGALVGLGDAPVSFVARDDIAAAAAGILAGQGHEGAIHQGTGPATWSGKERAAAVSTASDRKSTRPNSSH